MSLSRRPKRTMWARALIVACVCGPMGSYAQNDVSQYNLVWNTTVTEPSTNAKGNPIIGGGMPIGNGDTTALVFPVVTGTLPEDPCVSYLNSYCQMNDRIPCHDYSCQINVSNFSCPTPESCATRAATFCSTLADCVAFAVLNNVAPGSPTRVEFYHAAPTTALPFVDKDWTYFLNTQKEQPVSNPFYIPGSSVSFIVGKADAMASDTSLFKLGMVSLVVEPNPFIPVTADDHRAGSGPPFSQTLDLSTATVEINTPAGIQVRVWVDSSTNSVMADVGPMPGVSIPVKPFKVAVVLQSLHPSGRNFTYDGGFGFGAPMTTPDTLVKTVPPQLSSESLAIFHRNYDSDFPPAFNATLEQQGLGSLVDDFQNSNIWRHRTHGMTVVGSGMTRANAGTLQSETGTNFSVIVSTACNQTTSLADFWTLLGRGSLDPAAVSEAVLATRQTHEEFWSTFWDRSWIDVAPSSANFEGGNRVGDDKSSASLFLLSQSYAHTRYVQFIQSRHSHAIPIKFNGMAFTAQILPGDAVSRDWGANTWWQNTRLPYWTMMPAGDFDSMRVILDFYASLVPLLSARTQLYFNHSGIFATETKTLFGTFAPNDYGPNASTRTGKPGDLPIYLETNDYIHYDYGGNAGPTEAALMALDYLLYTNDVEAFARYFPFVNASVDFFLHHYPKRTDSGEVVFFPTQSIETFWCDYPPNETNCCTNDLPTIAAITSVLKKLLDLPAHVLDFLKVPTSVTDNWKQFFSILPPLPLNQAGDEFLPAASYPPQLHNSETPELYATHPYRIVSVGHAAAQSAGHAAQVVDLAPAISAFNSDSRAHSNVGWNQGVLNAALLGLSNVSSTMLLQRSTQSPAVGYRYPFFAPHLQDYGPSADHFANLASGLQLQLMQLADDGFENGTMVLLPSWPCSWDVSFRVVGPLNTIVDGQLTNGTLSYNVTPSSRASAVIALACQN